MTLIRKNDISYCQLMYLVDLPGDVIPLRLKNIECNNNRTKFLIFVYLVTFFCLYCLLLYGE